jgi:hypothetical protein
LVEKFREFLGSTHTLQYQPPGPIGRQWQTALSISSERLTKALARYGVVPQKSLTAEVAPCMTFNSWFWHGVVCGDGSLTWHRDSPSLSLCGSRRTAEQFLDFAKTIANTNASVRPTKNIYRVTLESSCAVLVARKLFKGSAISLLRKKAIADRFDTEFDDHGFRKPEFGGKIWLNHEGSLNATRLQLLSLHAQLHTWTAVAEHMGLSREHTWRIRRSCGIGRE